MQNARALIALCGLTLTAACANSAGADLTPEQRNDGLMRLSLRSKLVDASSVHVDVAQNGNTVAFADLDVGNQPLPGDANHVVGQGGDALFLLATGEYDVSATANASDGNALQNCSVAKKTGVAVQASQTTEIVLIIQCDSPQNGLLDTVVVVEQAPVLKAFSVTPNKFPCANTVVTIQAEFSQDVGSATAITAEVLSAPANAQPALNVESAGITFSADVEGDYTLQITGTAPLGGQSTQQVTLHVQAADAWNCQKL